MAISTNPHDWGMSSWEQHERMLREKQYEYERQCMDSQRLAIAARLEGSLGYVSQKPVTRPDDVRRRSTILLLKEEE